MTHKKTKQKVAKHQRKIANINDDFSHQTSRQLVDSNASVIVFEDLKTASMTRKPKPKCAKKEQSKNTFMPNGARAKAGLNKSILGVN